MSRKSVPSWLVGLLGLALLGLAGCSSRVPDSVGIYKVGRPYEVHGRWYHPAYEPSYDRTGIASWYGDEFHGRPTANGEFFDKGRLTAAHPTLPLPSLVRVTNLSNRRSVQLRVNDRGPFVGDRIIDVSQAAARELGFERHGTAPVRVEFVRLADARGRPPQVPEPAIAAAAPSPSVQLATAEVGRRCMPTGGVIQVGAFAQPERAQHVAGLLQSRIAAPVRTEAGADRLARVRLGPIPDAGEVEALLRELEQIGFANAFVVQGEPRTWQTC